jgi:hypothetical protein
MVPDPIHYLSILLLALGAACALWLALDVLRRPQKMGIMNVVWPVCALFGGPLVVWFYLRHGRAGVDPKPAFPVMVAKAALHCGSGCTLGDIVAETTAFVFPAILVWFGLHHVFDEKTFAAWVLDFVCAFALGILFQYFTIVPMRHLGKLEGIWAAAKADALSLAAWQVGMYGAMALAKFWLFPQVLGAPLEVNMPEFWCVMQFAMLAGFVTAYPVNWWLLKAGIKEKM